MVHGVNNPSGMSDWFFYLKKKKKKKDLCMIKVHDFKMTIMLSFKVWLWIK